MKGNCKTELLHVHSMYCTCSFLTETRRKFTTNMSQCSFHSNFHLLYIFPTYKLDSCAILSTLIIFYIFGNTSWLSAETLKLMFKKVHRPRVVSSMYILDSSNSTSITFLTSQFSSSSSNWTGTWTGNSNGSWTDTQSSHFSTAKEMRVKATFFFM